MKNAKSVKWLLIFASLLAALFAFTLAANAEIVDSGTCGAEGDGSNLTWTLDDAGTLTISGTGAIKDWPYFNEKEKDIKNIVIKNGVTSIGESAFVECENLTNVIIPNSVTTIGNYAFFGCFKITEIKIPDGVTDIGDFAFYGCTGLSEVTIPNCVTIIGNEAFSKCTGLAEVTFSNGVTSIGYSAFCDCTGLTEITIPNSVTTINTFAFSGCTNLTRVTIPNGVTSIGFGVFAGCANIEKLTVGKIIEKESWDELTDSKDVLKTVVITEGVTRIGSNSFSDFTSLTEVTFPDSLICIGESAFLNCENLAELTLPDSVTRIGSNAFDNTLWLYNQPDGVVLAGKVAIGYKGNHPQDKTLVVPNGTKGIGDSAFQWQYWLGNVVLPGSLESIGAYAFEECDNLSDVYYDGSEEQWKLIAIEKHNLPLSRYATIHYNHYTHTPGEAEKVTIKAATCTAAGSYVEQVYCVLCGKELSRNTIEQPAIGHNYGAWEKLDDAQHQRVCANDNTHVEKEKHAWDDGKITTEPTQTKEGVKTFTCTVCSATKTEPIPKAEPERTPGDVDGDGKITSADARLALRASVGLEPDITADSDAYLAADADGDGKVSSADARLILRASVGLEDPKTFGKKA